MRDDTATAKTRYSVLRRGNSDEISLQQKARGIVGGALACAFVAAALSNFVPNYLISDGLFTTGAAVAGGFFGKFYLIS